jgi:CubicO group peptidase (beta-lactamase class C family)
MNPMKQVFLPGLLLLLLSSCLPPETDSMEKGEPLFAVCENYIPPFFNDPERALKIAKVLEDAHPIYRKMAEDHHLPGVAYGLVVDGQLVFSGGAGFLSRENGEPASSRSLFRIASMSKSFTAMAILKLRDEGKLRLEDPVSMYLPELKGLTYLSADASPIHIRNLLTMTAGFPEDNPWGDRFLDMTEEELMEQVRQGIPFSNLPSLQYEYSNLGYGLLGQIIGRVSGLPYQEYIHEHILLPLGMTHTLWEFSEAPEKLLALGYRYEDETWKKEALLHDGAFGAMGGLITSIEDFSRYVSYHLQAWPPRNEAETGPVKRSTLREMHQMNHPRYWTDPDRFGSPGFPMMRGYGYGLVAMKDHNGIIEVGHNGGLPGFGSSYMFYPDHGIGIMAFSNLTYTGGIVRSANYQVLKILMDAGLFQNRELPASEILRERKEQVIRLLQTWDPVLEKEIVAPNLYLDLSREKRMQEVQGLLDAAGKISHAGPLEAENQMRGRFVMFGDRADIQVYFTLSPEPVPKVQWLSCELIKQN